MGRIPFALDQIDFVTISRNHKMEDLASAMFDNEETIQNSQGECWDGEEIHGCDDLAVIAQKSSPEFPCLVGRRQAPDIARDSTFGDVEAEFEELPVLL